MWTIQRDGHFEFNAGVFRAKLQTADFDTSHMDIDGGLLQIDVSASSAAIFTTANRDLLLNSDSGLIATADGPIVLTSGSGGDITLNADADLLLNGANLIDLNGNVRIGGGTPLSFVGVASHTWTGGSIGSHTTHTNTQAVPGAQTGDYVYCSSEPTGTGSNSKFLVGGRVTAAGTVTLYANNCDGAANSVTGMVTRVLVVRP